VNRHDEPVFERRRIQRFTPAGFGARRKERNNGDLLIFVIRTASSKMSTNFQRDALWRRASDCRANVSPTSPRGEDALETAGKMPALLRRDCGNVHWRLLREVVTDLL